MNNNTMNAKDSISGSQAECYVTIEGKRYNFKTIECTSEKNIRSVKEISDDVYTFVKKQLEK